MAIEIKELVIKLTVKKNEADVKVKSAEIPTDVKNQIIKDCVEKVLQKLESKIER